MQPPTDALEPGLAALLDRMRARPNAPRPNAEMLALADALSSAPLAAFARALGTHMWLDDFGEFETDAESVEDDDEIAGYLGELGHAGAEAICIGTSGGGEESLLMVADDARDGGYVIYKYARDGMASANGQPIVALGLIGGLVRAIEGEGEISDDLRAVLTALD